MTTRPRLEIGSHLWRGLSAIALFALLAVVFFGAGFPDPAGFEGVGEITPVIGYAMFGLEHPQQVVESTGTESFLIAFLIVAVVLDAALEAAVMLARREVGGEIVSALRIPGGEE
jgi:NADH-quinone oxidoreductase subunit J